MLTFPRLHSISTLNRYELYVFLLWLLSLWDDHAVALKITAPPPPHEERFGAI